MLRRWLGGALYSQVALDEEEGEGDEEMVVDFQHARKGEVELTQGSGDGGDGGKGDRREIHKGSELGVPCPDV